MSADTRLNSVRLYVGKNTIGKTPTCISHTIALQRAKPKNRLIVSDAQDKFMEAHRRGELRIDFLIGHAFWEWAEEVGKFIELKSGEKIYDYQDAHTVLDDYRMLLRGSDMPPAFYKLFALRPKMNMDYSMICHEPRNILEGVAGFITHFDIFANEASQSQFEKKISCYVPCQKASLKINQYVDTFGRGYYDVKNKQPLFPYIEVEKEKPYPLKCVNIDMNKFETLFTSNEEKREYGF